MRKDEGDEQQNYVPATTGLKRRIIPRRTSTATTTTALATETVAVCKNEDGEKPARFLERTKKNSGTQHFHQDHPGRTRLVLWILLSVILGILTAVSIALYTAIHTTVILDRTVLFAPEVLSRQTPRPSLRRRQQQQWHDLGTVISKVWEEDGIEYQGRIIAYDGESRVYRIQYEDGDVEDLDHEEVAHYIVRDEEVEESEEEEYEDDAYEDREEDQEEEEEDEIGEEEEYDTLVSSSSTLSPSLVLKEEEQDKTSQTDPPQPQQQPPYFEDTSAVVQQIYYSEDPPPMKRHPTTAILPAIHNSKNNTTITTTIPTASSRVPRNSIRLPSTKLWRAPRDFGGLEITTKRSTNVAVHRPATNTATPNTTNSSTTNTTTNTSLLPRRRHIHYDNNHTRLGLSSLIRDPDGNEDFANKHNETNKTETTTSTLMYDYLEGNYYYAYDDDRIRNPFALANTEAPRIRQQVVDTAAEEEPNSTTREEDTDEATESDYVYSSTTVPTTYIEKYEHKMRQEQKSCRRNRDYRLYFPNCNNFHDTDLLTKMMGVDPFQSQPQHQQQQYTQYIGSGAYREAFKIVTTRKDSTQNETFVMKDIALWRSLEYDMYEYTRMDAIVAERLTSSPRIYNIYGTCGIGILSEYFAHGDVEAMAVPETGYFNYQYYADTDEENEHEPKGRSNTTFRFDQHQGNHTGTNSTITTAVVPTLAILNTDPEVDESSFSTTPAQVSSALQRPRSRSHLPPVHNELSGYTKLKLSLHMAEAIADLHGYSGGTIVHQDIKLDQFFLNNDETGLILNDFNRAEWMLWDENEQEYCMYREGLGQGNWRSPEEYWDEYLTEKVDIYSLGNNLYTILTGLWVFYDTDDYATVQDLVGRGKRPFIDSRYGQNSVAEAKLVDIINMCHEYYAADRPSIFTVVDMLWEAIYEVRDHDQDDKEEQRRDHAAENNSRIPQAGKSLAIEEEKDNTETKLEENG